MSWQERLREATYTAPSGESITFFYEDVSVKLDKRTTAFNFPDADGTYVQDLGNSGRRFPLRMFISGSDYDRQAALLLNLLSEKGVARLDHPVYGVFDVIPFGTISRIDALKTEANQAVFDVTFWQTIGLVYPISQSDPASDVISSVDEFTEQASNQFADFIGVDTAQLRSLLQTNYSNVLKNVSNNLKPIADFQNDVRTTFTTIEQSINKGISTLIGDPLTLAFQTIELIKTPARAFTRISDRLNAYSNLSTQIIGDNKAENIVPAISEPSKRQQENIFYNNDLFVSSLVIGSVLSVVNTQFETKKEALQAAEEILQQFDQVREWRDDSYEIIEQLDTGEAYQKLQEAVSLCAGFLVEISFSLKQENSITLERNRTIIDLAAEIYGNVDDNLDFIINTNNLTGDEILELPRGREIVFYI